MLQKISAPIGPSRPNETDDVRLLQRLLNMASNTAGFHTTLVEDGRFGPKTENAILAFQRTSFGDAGADGIVAPNGQTFHRLTTKSKVAVPAFTATFVALALPAARAASKAWGVPVSVLIAQAALESSWGRSVKNNAYFGIKGKSESGNSSTFTTHEYVGGKYVEVQAKFRAYKDFDESADDYGRFLKTNKRYAACFLIAQDPEKFVDALAKAGYATDPSYALKIKGVIRRYGLQQYDI
jgi:peptidoglycan hydrolase FlgJ